jgi:hypothetical protein
VAEPWTTLATTTVGAGMGAILVWAGDALKARRDREQNEIDRALTWEQKRFDAATTWDSKRYDLVRQAVLDVALAWRRLELARLKANPRFGGQPLDAEARSVYFAQFTHAVNEWMAAIESAYLAPAITDSRRATPSRHRLERHAHRTA